MQIELADPNGSLQPPPTEPEDAATLAACLDERIDRIQRITISHSNNRIIGEVSPRAFWYALVRVAELLLLRGKTEASVYLGGPGGSTFQVTGRRGEEEVTCAFVTGHRGDERLTVTLGHFMQAAKQASNSWRQRILGDFQASSPLLAEAFRISVLELELLARAAELVQRWCGHPIELEALQWPDLEELEAAGSFKAAFRLLTGVEFPYRLPDDVRSLGPLIVHRGPTVDRHEPLRVRLMRWLREAYRTAGEHEQLLLCLEGGRLIAARCTNRRIGIFEDFLVPADWPALWDVRLPLDRLDFAWRNSFTFNDGLVVCYGTIGPITIPVS